MANVPHHPSSSKPGPGSGGPRPWADLIAYLAALGLGGVLIAFGHVPVGSLATVCVALGGLYAVWRFGPPGGPPADGGPPGG